MGVGNKGTLTPGFLSSPPRWRETKGSKLCPFVLRPSVRRPSVRDALKNLNNFAATGPFRAKLGW